MTRVAMLASWPAHAVSGSNKKTSSASSDSRNTKEPRERKSHAIRDVGLCHAGPTARLIAPHRASPPTRETTAHALLLTQRRAGLADAEAAFSTVLFCSFLEVLGTMRCA